MSSRRRRVASKSALTPHGVLFEASRRPGELIGALAVLVDSHLRVVFSPSQNSMKALRQSLLLAILAASAPLACRPEGYVAPPKEVEPTIPMAPEPTGRAPDADLVHHALYGVESAPPSVMTPPEDAIITQSGLTMKVLRPGTGQRPPRLADTIVIHFVGYDDQGQRFDSSVARGKPDRLRVETLESGWREGVLAMVVGEKRRLWIPERLAFGPVPTPGRPSGDVVLDVELLEIVEAPEAPTVPEDLTSPPQDALRTSSGLRHKLLQRGSGKRKPKPSDRVVVHYSGWTQDGTMFDSSVTRGEPAVFGVTQVIAGWTEALQLMVSGEKRRVWIPAELAYGDEPAQPGAPSGPLVFDIELIDIEE